MSLPQEPSLALELRGVRRGYSGFLGLSRREVLAGVNLDLARGRTLGLAGPNGSGKSTLLRLVAGVDRADAGVIRVLDGTPEQAAIRRRVGYLPEESPFPPELSARAGLDLLGSLQGMRRAERREQTERRLAQVGLTEHARTRLGRYSRGMLRRFGLAQAWLGEPDLLLLDEPTAGLDAQGFEVLAALLAEARARGAAVVLATHLVGDLRGSCDELAVILSGRIAARGTPDELLRGRSLLDLYREHAHASDAGRRP